MKRFFVTATNTDVGKTFVSSLLFNSLSNPCYFKPVQTGCIYNDDNSITIQDLEFIKNHSKIRNESNFKCSYKLKYPFSPHLSSRKMNLNIDIKQILKDFEEIKNKFKNVVVEGAGGAFTPLNEKGYFIYNLIKDLNTPCVLVTETNVGTINNTLLTLEHLKNNNINVKGIVFNKFNNLEHEIDNINFIKKYSKIENILILYDIKNLCEINKTHIENFINNI